MPLYNYQCNTCAARLQQRLRRAKRTTYTQDEFETEVLFETAHAMEPTPAELAEASQCPRCNGTDCVKSFYGSNITGYVRGNGYLDREGCHRDMNLHRLTTDDPYTEMRQPGEVDDLKVNLRRAGQHQVRPKHFVVSDLTAAVTKAVTTPPPAQE